MSQLKVDLYYHGKGEVNLEFRGISSLSFEMREHLSQVRVGILSQFGGETRDLTKMEVVDLVSPSLVRYLPSGVLIQVRLRYLSDTPTLWELRGCGEIHLPRGKTRFERMA
jgi:hypothetical protein